MAKLVTFMYANESRNDNNNGQNIQVITNPLLSLKLMFIPGQLSFSVIFGIAEFNYEEIHTAQFKLIDPDGNIVIDTKEFNIPKIGIDKNADGFIGSLDLRNVVFRTNGYYKTELFFDGEKLKDDTILVAEADTNGGNGI